MAIGFGKALKAGMDKLVAKASEDCLIAFERPTHVVSGQCIHMDVTLDGTTKTLDVNSDKTGTVIAARVVNGVISPVWLHEAEVSTDEKERLLAQSFRLDPDISLDQAGYPPVEPATDIPVSDVEVW
jgi:hypothetical protein